MVLSSVVVWFMFRKIKLRYIKILVSLYWFERPLPLFPGGLGTEDRY